MKEYTRNLMVGTFVVAGLGALALLMMWFGETPTWLGGSEWTLRITGVRELRGVGAGSPVSMNGVEIGRVLNLEFEDLSRPDQGVAIVARLKNLYSVPSGAIARVYGATLGFGTGRIEIVLVPGGSVEPLARESASIRGEMRSIVGEIVTKEMLDDLQRTITHIGNLTAEWTPVGTHLAKLLEQRPTAVVDRPDAAERGMVANLSTVVERIDRLVAEFNEVLGDDAVQEDVKTAVRDLRGAVEELKATTTLWKTESQKVANNLNGAIDRTEENLESSFRNLNTVLEHLDDSAKQVTIVLEQIAQGKGTAGMLVRDERLYEAAVLALQRFADAVGTAGRILGKVEDQGYVEIGLTPAGIIRKKYPVGPAANQAQ
ncbi:MAG: hypothetical protein HY763_10095 [Planctomycetes bacterium]|nr:hypothetical protein [Planctomycetota bacterium]